jgi:hypothetical protein
MDLAEAMPDGRVLQIVLCAGIGTLLVLCAIFNVNPGGPLTKGTRNFQIMLDHPLGRVVIGAIGVFLLGVALAGLLS